MNQSGTRDKNGTPGTLSVQQVTFFRQTGYLKLARFVEDRLVDAAIAQILRAFEYAQEPVLRDDTGKAYRLDAVFQRSGAAKELLVYPPLLDILESLLGPNIELSLNRHNHATLNHSGSSKFRLHRDILQWTRSLVTAIFYLEDASLENGCTWLIPASQYLPFVGTPNNGGTWMDEHSLYADLENQALPCPIDKGGILLFDSLAFHTVGENRTSGTRISVAAGYHSVDELDLASSSDKRALVRGSRIYRGNDGDRR